MSSTDGRVLGLQVSTVLVFPDRTVTEFGPILSADFNFVAEMPKQHYLGERAQRYDEVYQGVEGKLDAHLDNPKWFDFAFQVQQRQQRLVFFKINLNGRFQFSDGQVRRLVIPDISIGTIPLGASSATDYVKTGIDFGASYAFARK